MAATAIRSRNMLADPSLGFTQGSVPVTHDQNPEHAKITVRHRLEKSIEPKARSHFDYLATSPNTKLDLSRLGQGPGHRSQTPDSRGRHTLSWHTNHKNIKTPKKHWISTCRCNQDMSVACNGITGSHSLVTSHQSLAAQSKSRKGGLCIQEDAAASQHKQSKLIVTKQCTALTGNCTHRAL